VVLAIAVLAALTASASAVAAPATPRPSYVTAEQPKVTPSTASQAYGTTFTIDNGRWRTEASDATITNETAFGYQWQRCDGGPCETIVGATAQSYTTTSEDIGHSIGAYVMGSRNGLSSPYYLAGQIGIVQNRFPVNTIKPQIMGNPFTGSVLSSNIGAWDGFEMRHEQRWLRCNQDGLACNPTNPVVTGSAYGLTPADKGSRLVLEIRAIAADPSQDRVTTATSDPTPIIGDPPGSPTGPPPTGGPPVATPQKPTVKISKPTKLKPGAKLKVPAALARFRNPKYQWLRNGKKIKGATKRVYKIAKKDRGKKLSCRISLTPAAGGPAVTVKTRAIKVPAGQRRRG
jgi:hypothetical protein